MILNKKHNYRLVVVNFDGQVNVYENKVTEEVSEHDIPLFKQCCTGRESGCVGRHDAKQNKKKIPVATGEKQEATWQLADFPNAAS